MDCRRISSARPRPPMVRSCRAVRIDRLTSHERLAAGEQRPTAQGEKHSLRLHQGARPASETHRPSLSSDLIWNGTAAPMPSPKRRSAFPWRRFQLGCGDGIDPRLVERAEWLFDGRKRLAHDRPATPGPTQEKSSSSSSSAVSFPPRVLSAAEERQRAALMVQSRLGSRWASDTRRIRDQLSRRRHRRAAGSNFVRSSIAEVIGIPYVDRRPMARSPEMSAG